MAKKKVELEVGDPNVELPFETASLRKGLDDFLNTKIDVPAHKIVGKRIGDFQWGVYAFYDFDGEPIYVGQTNEKVRVRVRRHLTNQRTDAVAMSVLDPQEVCEVCVWPIPELDGKGGKDKEAKAYLTAVEFLVYQKLLKESQFNAVLNEKIPTHNEEMKHVKIPATSLRQRVVSEGVSALRDHPDLRMARRASTMARLAKIISERKVAKGLRIALHTQAKRLEAMAALRIGAAQDLTAEEDAEIAAEGKEEDN